MSAKTVLQENTSDLSSEIHSHKRKAIAWRKYRMTFQNERRNAKVLGA